MIATVGSLTIRDLYLFPRVPIAGHVDPGYSTECNYLFHSLPGPSLSGMYCDCSYSFLLHATLPHKTCPQERGQSYLSACIRGLSSSQVHQPEQHSPIASQLQLSAPVQSQEEIVGGAALCPKYHQIKLRGFFSSGS